MSRYWGRNFENSDISALVGKVISKVEVNQDKSEIYFETECGNKYIMYHEQDCCESVYIEDINGDLQALVGETILLADEYTEHDRDEQWGDSCTFTFYHIRSMKENISMRWCGSSNGYYSESVDFVRVKSEEEKQES